MGRGMKITIASSTMTPASTIARPISIRTHARRFDLARVTNSAATTMTATLASSAIVCGLDSSVRVSRVRDTGDVTT